MVIQPSETRFTQVRPLQKVSFLAVSASPFSRPNWWFASGKAGSSPALEIGAKIPKSLSQLASESGCSLRGERSLVKRASFSSTNWTSPHPLRVVIQVRTLVRVFALVC
jgi:hypothetical protein